jgi:hypothetical protein
MGTPHEWPLAFDVLRAFQNNLPGLIDQDCVAQYNAIIQSLEKTENLDLQDFTVDVQKLSFKVVVAQTADHAYPPRRIQYSNKKYCDIDYFYGKLDGLRAFLIQAEKNNL